MVGVAAPFIWQPETLALSTKRHRTDRRALVKRGRRRAKATARPTKKKTVMVFHSCAYPLRQRTTRRWINVKHLKTQPRFEHVVQLPIISLINVTNLENPHD